MTVISHRNLLKAADRHPNAIGSVERWFHLASGAHWRHLVDVRTLFPGADQVGTALVFNISGNNYRLICCVDFERQWLFFRALLTHAEYDRTNVRELCP